MITRFEIVDYRQPLEQGGGRESVVQPDDGAKVTYDVQDDGRTLKVFIEDAE